MLTLTHLISNLQEKFVNWFVINIKRMKHVFSIFLLTFFLQATKAQLKSDTTTFRFAAPATRTVQLRIDTNEVVYDKRGKALRYYQYKRLLQSGEYTIRVEGDPESADRKYFLKRKY